MNGRLLIMGWEGADWAQMHPLLDAGKLPNLLRLVEAGSSGALTGLSPALEPIVWTSIATGRQAEAHGVLADVEIRPDKGGVQPIGQRSWKAPAFWELLAASGLSTAVVNWPATSPATRWPGIVVDESFATPSAMDFDTWPLAPHCVSPTSWREEMRELRLHPREIALSDLVTLVPRAAAIDQKRDRRLGRLSVSLARTISMHSAATYIAEFKPWDMLAVRYTLLADAARDIAIAQAAGNSGDEIYAGVGERVCCFLDMMLGRLLTLAGPETRVLLIAPHARSAQENAHSEPCPDRPHSGMMLASGPGFVADALLQGASLLDIFPTVLHCFGASAESSGRVLTQIFTAQQKTCRAISVPRAAVQNGKDPADALIALGYEDTLNTEARGAIIDAEATALANLGDSFLARAEWRKAAESYRATLLRKPDHFDANVRLCHALLQLSDVASARPIAEKVRVMAPQLPWGDLLIGVVLVLEGCREEAASHLQRARELAASNSTIMLRIAWVDLLLGRAAEAEAAFRAVLAKDANSAEAYTGLGISLDDQARYAEAEWPLRTAIALQFTNPVAHARLAQVLVRLGKNMEAAKVLRIALAQQPASPELAAMLERLERQVAFDLAKRVASEHR
jgi:tetratricopeptide (TPR) repeat protein